MNEEISPINRLNLFKRTKEDSVYVLIMAALGFIPYMGAVTPIISEVVKPPIYKRFEKFLISIDEQLQDLENRIDNFNKKEILEDPAFFSILIHASQIALRTHQEEKLEALQNAIINSALKLSPDDDLQLTFLNYIDTFTILHIKLLDLYNTPKSQEWVEKLVGSFNEHEETNDSIRFVSGEAYFYLFPEFDGKYYIIENVIRDLYNKGLINVPNANGGGIYYIFEIDKETYRITPSVREIGQKFLSYISPPEILE